MNSWEHHGKGKPRAERMMSMYRGGHSLQDIASAHGGISRQAVHATLCHFFGKDYTKQKGKPSWKVDIQERNDDIAQAVIALGERYYISPNTVAGIIQKLASRGRFSKIPHAILYDNTAWCDVGRKYCKCEINCEEES